MVTPVEEVLQTLGELVRAGSIRYFGFSNTPAWYTTKAVTLAQVHHVPGPVAMQLEYSLVARTPELEHVAAARDGGLRIVPRSPLAAGFLAGTYTRTGEGVRGHGRLSGPNPFDDTKFTGRNWTILDARRVVADQVGHSPTQVALAWLAARPGVSSILVGASRAGQLQDSLASLTLTLSSDQLRTLDRVSGAAPVHPESMFSERLRRAVFGGSDVNGWP